MESFMESLNRLKDIHEKEVVGECQGSRAGRRGPLQVALTWTNSLRTKARPGGSYMSPPFSPNPGPHPLGPDRTDPESRAAMWPGTRPQTNIPEGGPTGHSPKGSAHVRMQIKSRA